MFIFYVKCALFVLALFFLVTEVVLVGKGEGVSMNPTLFGKTVVFGNRLDKNYQVEDIVTTYPLERWGNTTGVIKRIVAMPGDSVIVDGISLYVNDNLIDASVMKPGYPYKEYKLGSDEYFIVGDNRSHSLDSRAFGPITFSDIESKITFWINY